MGNYLSTDNLIDRFADDAEVLHVVDNATGLIGDATTLARLDDAIGNAEGEMDGYLARRYSVPVDVSGDTNLAATLKYKAADIATYYLVARSDFLTDAVQQVYDNTIKWLEKISEGVIYLPAASPPASTDSSTPIVAWGDNDSSENSERLFTRTTQRSL